METETESTVVAAGKAAAFVGDERKLIVAEVLAGSSVDDVTTGILLTTPKAAEAWLGQIT